MDLPTGASLGSVFIASIIGSAHCAGMCGGFAALAGERSFAATITYNLGRLVTYLTIGALAGSVGATLNRTETFTGVANLASIVVGVLLLWIGFSKLPRSGAVNKSPSLLLNLSRKVEGALSSTLAIVPPTFLRTRALLLGSVSTLLPCGWLYSFAVIAAGSGTALNGILVMAFFWCGTLPVLSGIGALSGSAQKYFGPLLPRLVPLCLILGGATSLVLHLLTSPTISCH